jgi:hypothetical protein
MTDRKLVEVTIWEDEVEILAAVVDMLDAQIDKLNGARERDARAMPADAFLVYSDLRTARRREDAQGESVALARLAGLPKPRSRRVERALRRLGELRTLEDRRDALRLMWRRFEGEMNMAASSP